MDTDDISAELDRRKLEALNLDLQDAPIYQLTARCYCNAEPDSRNCCTACRKPYKSVRVG